MALTIDQLAERVIHNDNRCTAQPYLLLLQEKRTYAAHPEYGTDTEQVWVETVYGNYKRFTSESEMIEWFKEYEGDPEFEPAEGIHYETYREGYYWETTNVFFTDKGYQDHLELNAHNLGEHRTYGIHAFRNPEMKLILETLQKIGRE